VTSLTGPRSVLGLIEAANALFLHAQLLLPPFAFHLLLSLNDRIVVLLLRRGTA
jgi:hypothetical protein